jgi:hypothetical protein
VTCMINRFYNYLFQNSTNQTLNHTPIWVIFIFLSEKNLNMNLYSRVKESYKKMLKIN